MLDHPTYKNITATVRPARCAILINESSPHWQAAVSGTIAAASEVWGGRHFLIVPTDGDRIKDKYWELLEAYSPDHLALYNLTFADMEYSETEKYTATKERYRKEFGAQGLTSDFEDWFAESAASSQVDSLTISETLATELLARLSPLHNGTKAVVQHISRRNGFSYPFTQLADIIPHATRRPSKVTLPPDFTNPTLALLVISQTGVTDPAYTESLATAGVEVEELSNDHNMIELLTSAFEVDSSAGLSAAITGNPPVQTPFSLSMLHLGQYYRVDQHHDYREPVTVVVGDTVDDYCLYYSLSRLHEKVCWLPLSWLRACYRNMNQNRRRYNRGEESLEENFEQRACRALINLFFRLIDYGHHEKRIQLRSMSLTKNQLTSYKRQLADCSYTGITRYKEKIDCVPIEATSTSCFLRVFEENNYANHQSVVFLQGETLSPFATPKPKNFTKIDPSKHHWMTSVQIEGYKPPSLQNLATAIVDIRGVSSESRVANDGIAYHCPNFAYFGGDIDVCLVRPKIRMPDEMAIIGAYFADAGMSIHYSDKGNYFIDTIERFRGLDNVAQFIKNPKTRSILDNFMAKRNSDDGSVIYLTNDQRAYLNLRSLATSLDDEIEAADLADALIEKRVLQRGYILQCQRCRLSSWYSLDVLTADFVCGRCSFRQKFTRQHWRQPIEPTWYYRLAETVYQFYENNSHLTTQTLYHLKQRSKLAFHYVPEIELVGFPAQGKKRELDIACVVDGQIFIGECKTEDLQARDVDKFLALARKLYKRPDGIVFSTTKASVTDSFALKAATLGNSETLTFSDLYER